MDFDKMIKQMELLTNMIMGNEVRSIDDFTRGEVKKYLNCSEKIAGIFILFNGNKPVYVGRTKDLAQRVGSDIRSKDKNAANVTKRIMDKYEFEGMEEARNYVYSNFSVSLLKVEDVYLRTLLQVYIHLKYNTEFNSFEEH